MVLLALCAAVSLSELLVRHTRARWLGSALVVILIGALLANLGLIPAGSTQERPEPVYDVIFTWLAPLAIFWLLLQVELRRILEAGSKMLAMFLLGSAGVVLGVLVATLVLGFGAGLDERLAPVSGMYVGTYIGGSINFNAIAIHHGIHQRATLFASAVVIDNIVSTVWMVVTLALPRWLDRAAYPSSPPRAGELAIDEETLDPRSIATILALGLAALLGSRWLAERTGMPSILIVTVLALVLAQLPRSISRAWPGARALGMFAVYLFLAVVGAHCDLAALGESGPLGFELLGLAGTIVIVHGLVIFVGGRLLQMDPAMSAVASQANVGGGTTALALARGLGRDDLVVPGILCGAIGNAIGTFVGFWIVTLLDWSALASCAWLGQSPPTDARENGRMDGPTFRRRQQRSSPTRSSRECARTTVTTGAAIDSQRAHA